jgi:hypothetical protein
MQRSGGLSAANEKMPDIHFEKLESFFNGPRAVLGVCVPALVPCRRPKRWLASFASGFYTILTLSCDSSKQN